MKIISGIYLIKNILNNKVYVGFSKDIINRWIDHKYRLNNNKHENCYLQNAWNKYGANNFEFILLESIIIPNNNLSIFLEREDYYIDKYDSCNRDKGYNIRPKSQYHTLSEETKMKLSSRVKGKKYEELYGNKRSQEIKNKLSESHKGYKMPKSQKEKLSKKSIEFWNRPENKKKQSEDSKIKWKDLEFRKKTSESISKALKGRKIPESVKLKIRKTLKGISYEDRFGKEKSDEIKLKLSKINKNKKMTDESKIKISESQKKLSSTKSKYMKEHNPMHNKRSREKLKLSLLKGNLSFLIIKILIIIF